MIKKILFSPIGGSDPINAGYDGAWLHCCRWFKPDLTVIYLSAEMLKRETDNQIFSVTLDKFNNYFKENKDNNEILLEMEKRPDLNSPQDFEAFYDDFESVLTKYVRAHLDDF